jgi:two-component system chemotaxis response regulator CheB
MPALFIHGFVERLDQCCAMKVKEAKKGDVVTDGLILVAPGDGHMTLDWLSGKYRVNCQPGPMVNHCRPSVDVLFHSVARTAGPNAVGVILTGMGEDGAGGLLALREAGAFTLAQDEDSCVVYGMPREAVVRGAVDEVVPLYLMAQALQGKIQRLLLSKQQEEHHGKN